MSRRRYHKANDLVQSVLAVAVVLAHGAVHTVPAHVVATGSAAAAVGVKSVDSVTMVVAVGVIGMQAPVDCTAQRAAVTVHMVAATMMIIRATTIRTIGAVELEPPAVCFGEQWMLKGIGKFCCSLRFVFDASANWRCHECWTSGTWW